jgi:hypothetical protein
LKSRFLFLIYFQSVVWSRLVVSGDLSWVSVFGNDHMLLEFNNFLSSGSEIFAVFGTSDFDVTTTPSAGTFTLKDVSTWGEVAWSNDVSGFTNTVGSTGSSLNFIFHIGTSLDDSDITSGEILSDGLSRDGGNNCDK